MKTKGYVLWGNVIPLLLMCVIIIIGICTACNTDKKTPLQTELFNKYDIVITDTITLSGCEYYVVKGGGARNQIVHKGNCINPIHQQTNNQLLSRKVDSLINVLNLKQIHK